MYKPLRCLSAAIFFVSIVVMTSGVLAQEPVAQARTLLEQKKYEEAEKILEKELAKKNPAAEALRIGMEVAVADGRIVTASQRAKTLLRVTENKDLGLVYRAGQVALMAGQDSLALSRFRTFADKSSEKSSRMKYALDYVLQRGVYLDGCTKYLNFFGADNVSWHRGTRLLEQLFADDEPKKALEAARVLFGHYAANTLRADHVATRLADIIQGTYNRNGRLAYEALEIVSARTVNNQGKLNHILDMAWPFINAKQRVDAMARIQKNYNVCLYSGLLNKFQEMINLPKDDDKLKAGRTYLSFEPTYRDAPQRDRYKDYLWVILERPQVFHIAGNELVNDAQIQEKFAVLAGKFRDHPNVPDALNNHVHRLLYHYLQDNREAQISFLKTHAGLLHRDRFRELVAWTEGKELAAQLAAWARGKGPLAVDNMKFQVLDWYNKLKRKNDLLASCKTYMMSFPGHWDSNHMITHLMNSPLLSPEEKIAALKDILGKTGLSAPLIRLVKELTKRDKAWRENAAFQAFKKGAEGRKTGSNLVMTTAAQLRKIKVNHGNPSKEILPIVEAFLAKYTGVIPGDRGQAHSIEQRAAYDIFDIHLHHMWNKPGPVFKVLELWAPKFVTTGSGWDKMIRRAQEHGGSRSGRGGSLWEPAQRYAALLDKGQKGSNEVFYRFANAHIHPKGSKSLFSNHYTKMGRHAITYVSNQVDSSGRPEYDGWSPAHYLGEVEKLLKAPGIEFNKNDLREIIRRVYQRSSPKNKPSDGLVQTLSDRFRVEEARSGSYDLEAETWLCGLHIKGGRGDAARKYLDSHLKALGTRKPHERMNALMQLANWGHLPAQSDREYVLLNLLKPVADKLPAASWPRVGISYRIFQRMDETEKGAARVKKTQVQQLRGLLAEKALTSALITREKRNITGYLTGTVLKMSREKRWEQALGAIHVYVNCIVDQSNWGHSYRYHVQPVVAGLEKIKASEPLYVFTDMLGTRVKGGRETAIKQLAAIKARVVRDIPGLVPVDKSDPTHDLHLAAREFMLGNEPRAWELTRPKLKILQQKWVNMDIFYVAWVIEQMRKQKLHKEALEFCFTVLMKEFDYDAESMARISLAKGDVYRDRENYQAARIEYQGLYDNKRYRRTEAGKLAKYRLISLMILTKDYTAAEQKLERLVDAGTLREQAEAYYLFAKMSYEQQEHKQAHDYLREVFKRIHGHVYGRLLEGELRLLLPRGLASTEVAIGRLDLQTVAIPGRELTLKLQDNNLSIARGGKAIPVVVTTTNGGDEEKMNLMVSSDDETLFTGKITTGLGEPTKNNLLLEIGGLDHVSYQIEPGFQKANDLHYPPKILEVKANARLVASAGEILSREEQEKREMERRLAATQREEISARFRNRNNRTVRPGSPIYVQVTDLDRDVSSEADSVPVTLVTSSGDALDDFTLTETGPHTGVFEARVPTGIPFPMATASDSLEGQDPNTVINSTRPETWTSLPDGKKPKWIEVDTMTSHSVREISIETPDTAAIRKVSLLGSLAGDLGMVASFPEVTGQTKGGLTVEMKSGSNHLAHDIRRQLRRRVSETYWVEKPDYNRHDTRIGKRNGWYITRMKGMFWLKENKMLELKLLQERTVHGWQWAHVFVDGETFISSCIQANELKRTRKMFLGAGVHTLEILVRDHWENSRVIVGYRQEDGTFATLPAEWFSTDENPDLAKLLQPKGKIERTESGFTARLAMPHRFRRLRWVFEDFNGNSVSVKSITILDIARKPIIPSAKDFSTGKTNDILEVAAGDRIEVTYNDDRRLDKDKPVLNAALDSSFANGKISLCYEEFVVDPNGKEQTIYSPAKRVRKGDQLMVIVEEYDEDLTENRDKIAVQITSSSGENLALQTLETAADTRNRGESAHDHAGTFFQVLKFGDITGKNTIKIKDGDRITAGYLDRENVDPGVAVTREYQVLSPGPITPEMAVYQTHIKMVEDKGEQAKRRIKQLRLQGDKREEIKVFKAQVVAELPEDDADDEERIISASVQAPLLLEAFYPGMALHMRSRCEVVVVAESELKAAKAEDREPSVLKVPLVIDDISQIARRKGYDVRVQNHVLQRPEAMLAEGRFAGVVRLQMGAPGDPVDDLIRTDAADFGRSGQDEGSQDERFRVPTMIVAGSDMVHISIKDETGAEVAKQTVRLLSDGRMALMDRTYTVPSDAIHLGQKFHVLVTDPDHDVSPERDVVSIKVAVNGGDEMKVDLQETLPHSGIFSAAIKPDFVEKDEQGAVKRPDKTDNVIRVDFGNELVFEYIDDMPLTSDTSIRVATKGLIHKGANGRLAGFTKRFKDPEMAVKTRFLTAEALFEMAKDHRKLKKIELADKEIGEGKRILEEAMRDYPDTSLVAQGEFLLANLAQEMKKYQEAIGRYSSVISNWPDSEYAARSQFKKAICLEKMEHYEQSCEEYVRLTYLYPENSLVADATVRLGNYYYKRASYSTAGRIFEGFQKRHPEHDLAVKALFLAGQSYMKMESERGEGILRDYGDGIKVFTRLIDEYPDEKVVRSEAMYWLGESYFRNRDYVKAYRSFKKLTWDYPETKWAKIARGRLTEESLVKVEENEASN